MVGVGTDSAWAGVEALLLERLEVGGAESSKAALRRRSSDRPGKADLFPDDLADKRVQFIVIFDPHKMVDDVASSHRDNCWDGRHL